LIVQSLIDLLCIARPQFLASGLALFGFGVAWAVLTGSSFDLARVAAAYAILFPAHLAVSYSNDFFDVDADRFGTPTFFSGGSGVLVTHPGLRRASLWIAVLLHLCSLLGSVLYQLTYQPTLWVPIVVLAGNAVAWWYTAPPLRLVYRGLGEIAMALSVGVLMPGLGYLATGAPVSLDALWPCLPLMLFGLGFVLAVQIPDMEADRLGGKWTWVARHGRRSGFGLIALALAFGSLWMLGAPAPAWALPNANALVRPIGLLALLPLGLSIPALLRRQGDRRAATRAAHAILIGLVTFCVLADGYLLLLIWTQPQ
jgi:1,4-dihydroxy-2-naphthoate octaprenyltransferase